MTLLPTKFRHKLPPGLSYPLGAEVLSRELEAVPQYARIGLWFLGSDRPNPEPRPPYSALQASFRHMKPGLTGSNAMIEEGWYEPTWEISVGAVPSRSRNSVRQALLEEGIPAIRSWLSAKRPETWYQGRKSITVSVDPAEEHVQIREAERP